MTPPNQSRIATALSLASVLVACNALDEPDQPDVDGPGIRRVVPTDTRAALQASSPPPPISGGTLVVTADGTIVAADPARDRLSIIGAGDRRVTHIALQPGDEPGRLVEDWAGRVHVALRRGGDVVTIDPQAATIVERRAVCGAPRGIAADVNDQSLVVACAGGELMRMPGAGGSAQLVTRMEPGLRDVVVGPTGLQVTNFKRAELITLDADGNAARTQGPRSMSRVTASRTGEPREGTMSPSLAWKTVAAPDGVYMLHQRASDDTIDIDPRAEGDPAALESPYGGGEGLDGGSGCNGIVNSGITRMGEGPVPGHTSPLRGVTLAVDMAVGPEGMIAIAVAGTPDPEAPRPSIEVRDGGRRNGGDVAVAAPSADIPGSGLVVVDDSEFRVDDAFGACAEPHPIFVNGEITAVAFSAQGELVAQSREPARIYVGNPRGQMQQIELGGASIADTGHALFHRDTGAGIACASCHAEGGDDGHVWDFSTIGRRRTQAMHVGLEGTAPFHWDGDMDDLAMLMTEVFVGRMGGVHQSDERLETLRDWVFALRPAAPVRQAADADPLVSMGEQLFMSAEVGCAECHAGSKLTNSESFDVGTGAGHPLQVPSLVGIAYRAPFMHTGCAQTLLDRFDPSCGGGDEHGRTSQLDDTQLDALVAYLETL